MVIVGVEDSSVMRYESVIYGHHMFTKGHGAQELVRFDALYKLFSL